MDALSLHEIQQSFVGALRGENDALANLTEAIDDSFGADHAERIGVYANAYYVRLQAVLAQDFSRTRDLLGNDFPHLSRDYIASHPSRHPSVIWFGRNFADFLAEAREDMPWLAEVAHLEWLRIEAFYAPGSDVLTVSDLASIPSERWPEVSFVTVPSLRVADCRWPAHSIWAGQAASKPEASSVRVWRNEAYQVLHAKVDPREAAALARLRHGEPLAAIAELFVDQNNAPAEIAALIGRWLEDGLIRGAQIPQI